MDFSKNIQALKQLVERVPLNAFDIILLITFGFYVYEEASIGFIPAFINLVSIVIAFIVGIFFYHSASGSLVHFFSISKGLSDAISFLVICSVVYFALTNILTYLTRKHRIMFPSRYSKIGGAVCGMISFLLIAAFIIALLLSFPVSTLLKNQIRNSATGSLISERTQALEFATKRVFGGAIDETLNFLTIKPDADTTVTLHFRTNSGTIDKNSEKEMLFLINAERAKRNLPTISSDEGLTNAARNHAKDMLKRGYFSHYTPEGLSPFDRMEQEGVSYATAAENLALAPEVEIAMSGLMKSTGHRRNILDKNFKRVGVGVIDAGIYGKMFVQEFAN